MLPLLQFILKIKMWTEIIDIIFLFYKNKDEPEENEEITPKAFKTNITENNKKQSQQGWLDGQRL